MQKFGIAANNRYDHEDIQLLLGFMKLTKSKNVELVSGMLRDYTLGTSQGRCAYKDRVEANVSDDIVRTA